MTQLRSVAYHALDTSALHNERLASTVRPGVYRGYKLRVNASEPDRLDLTAGDDGESVLLTVEGVKIKETSEIAGAFVVANADPTLARIDLAVAEYRASANDETGQQYKVLRGRYPVGGADPTPPEVQSVYQLPLAYLHVRPQTASGGSLRARLTTTDVVHVGRAADVRAPEDVSSLMPIIEPSDRQLIFVHAGILPNFDGTGKLVFPGGYSTAIDPDTLTEGDTRWYLFGVSDDATVATVGDAATESELPSFIRDVFPVCAAEAKKIGGVVVMQALTDLRFPFARQIAARNEEDIYKATLADSVFEHVRIESFRDLDILAEDTLSDADVAVTLNRGDTSAEFKWEGAGDTPAADVTIATTDLLSGTSIGVVEHFMLVVDADVPGLEMQFSASSRYAGFSAATFRPNTVVRVPAGGATRLFVRFIMPAERFADGATLRMRSFGCFLRLNQDVLSVNTVADVGLDTLQFAVPNLIANGNFRYWSRDDVDGNTPDPDAQTAVDYAVSTDEPYAADGWQFTTYAFSSKSGRIGRRGLSRDVLDSGDANYGDTALLWEGEGGSAGAVNVLEYRTPVPPGADGRRVTFAIKYKASSLAAFSIGVALYELTAEKTLLLQSTPTFVTPSVVRGDLLTVSDIALNERTYAVAFLLQFRQTSGDSSVAVWNARAAVGEYRSLLYTETVDASDILRKYYERGRLFVAGTAQEGSAFGGSAQFGARKFAALGTLMARTIQQSDSDRSLNLTAAAYDVTADGLVATATTVSGGSVRIDVDYEAFVRYELVS